MADPVIRPRNVAVLVKLESTEGEDASPVGNTDAIPVEADSVGWNSPYREENSNEATGSLVAGAPLIVGQPATIRFRSRLKGAGLGVTYTSVVKPPLHAPYSACGKRGFFQAAVSAAVLAAGGASEATLEASFAATAQLYRGMPLVIGAGVGDGAIPFVSDYTVGRVATLTDSFSPVLDTTTSVSIPDNWTYAGTSPADNAARATDHPSATIYVYEDGLLRKFLGCRGQVTLEGNAAGAGFESFEFTGVYAGLSDAGIPTNLTVANHSGPLLLQGSALSEAFHINRKALPISQFSISDGAELESPDDPNTTNGFGPGQIGGRTPRVTCDPLATLVATRNTLAEIAAGSVYPGIIRFGYAAGNRIGITLPQLQPVAADPGTRGSFRSEQVNFRAINPGRDSNTRDGDVIRCFY
ncbi:hypothetical protein BSL82_02305 [Tardibacter chloracetimidivorans]|uniref:Uncharacterized protein n=1 Tax=Tardibacter chloracetimidivorans TaxID=1921510 RepID=A0A1L3ZRQ0_9SPHN|nr:hypothetical protein [Tardibacter chloracetimidivorans]API58280.1 hypothetical protein BSL82_02305 [Tardibacter chloracetimidivorans]